MNPESKSTVRQFQCPGCIHGCDTNCGKYEKAESHDGCGSHHPSTVTMNGKILLGLPRGFNRLYQLAGERTITQFEIQLDSPKEYFDRWNIPVWKTRYEGHVLVRGLRPRTSIPFIIVFGDLGKSEYDSIDCLEITPKEMEEMD